jgi:hypothetical protein
VPVRIFDMTLSGDNLHDIGSDFADLMRRAGGRTRSGYVLRDGFPPDEPWGFDRHDPQVQRQQAELSHFGDLRTLSELFTILRADPRPADEQSPNTSRLLTGRGISVSGEIDPELPVAEASRTLTRAVALQAGDVVVTEFLTMRARIALVESHHLPLGAGRGVLVLRPVKSIDSTDVELLRSLFNSTIGRRLIASHSSNIGGALRLTPAGLRELPVPLADAALKDAVAAIADSQLALKEWQSEGDGLLANVFDAPSAAEARRSIIARSRHLRARVESAELLDDPGYTVRTTYPYPVAYRWRTVEAHRHGSDPSILLDAVLACFETLLAYCAQLALVMARTAQVDLGGYAELRKKLAGGLGAGLGDWIRILDEVASNKKLRSLPPDHPLGELRAFLKTSNQDVTTARIRLNGRRNDDAHGRRPTSAAAIRETAEKSLVDLQILLAGAAFLADLPFLHITDNRWDSLAGRGVAEMRILKGDHPVAPYQLLSHNQAGLEKGSLYVKDTLGGLHLLRPFLVGIECPRCEIFSVFHVDYKSPDGTVIIKSLENGHTTAATEELVDALRTVDYC